LSAIRQKKFDEIVKVSVVIPCRNEKKFIKSCIDAVFAGSFLKIGEIEVIVVDGLSDDGTLQVLDELSKKYPSLIIVRNEKRVTPVAFNLGINASTGDFIQIIGARQIIASDYIELGVKFLNQNPSVWCVGGQVENVFENEKSRSIAAAMDTPFGVGMGNFRILKRSGYTDTVGTPMYPREVFDKVGMFDENLVRNQDDEFNYRITKAGGLIYLNLEMHTRYFVRASFTNLFKQYFQYGYWKVFVNKKHKAITTFRQLVPPLWILFLFTGWVPGFIHPVFLLVYFGMLGLYFSGALFYALKKANPKLRFISLFYTFMILHFAYGTGYLNGILHFYVMGKNPSSESKTLSR
jgi:glycosyltransferase involved in cell wall biosynthesis